ncbi:MAG TPA: hypothetical protein VH593_19885, partial [Ktedonobacteraceae bacterium]
VLSKGGLVACLVLLILSSIGGINTALFPAASGTAGLHWTLGFLLALLPLVVVYTIVGWQWRRMSDWRGYGWYSLATAVGSVVLILLSFIILSPRSASGGPSSQIGGLVERVLVLVVFAWHVVVGWRLFALAGPLKPGNSSQER